MTVLAQQIATVDPVEQTLLVDMLGSLAQMVADVLGTAFEAGATSGRQEPRPDTGCLHFGYSRRLITVE